MSLRSSFSALLLCFAGCSDPSPPDVSDLGTDSGDAGVDTSVDDADSGMDAGDDIGLVDAGPFMPDLVCPGPSCVSGSSGGLFVGAAIVDITPVIDDSVEQITVDVNGDGSFDTADDSFGDTNGNGIFDGVWIAGYGNGRPATEVADPQWARAIVLENTDVSIGLVSIDCVGFFFDDVERIRARVADLELDYVLVAATHSHEAQDTMGRWGESFGRTGIDPEYMERVYAASAQALRQAFFDKAPANIEYANTRLRDKPGGVRRYISDSRDPNIIDDEIRILRFLNAGADTTIATLVNFGAHPEYLGSRNTRLSSDFAHTLRLGIEEGVDGPDGRQEGVGGIAVFFNGAIGAQIGPNDLSDPQTFDGVPFEDNSFELTYGIGEQLAYFALRAMAEGTREESAALGVRSTRISSVVENRVFHFAFNLGLFPTRQAYDYVERWRMSESNMGSIRSEVAFVDIGRARLLLIPGELDPSLFVGGYDGAFTPEGVPIVNTDIENHPDLGLAPEGPYLRERAQTEDIDFVFLVGLANDELGYLIPRYDFQLDERAPYLARPPGDHYEETVAISPSTWPTIERAMNNLLAWER